MVRHRSGRTVDTALSWFAFAFPDANDPHSTHSDRYRRCERNRAGVREYLTAEKGLHPVVMCGSVELFV
jgi:hypothetical protein